jgi:hypothetical protein
MKYRFLLVACCLSCWSCYRPSQPQAFEDMKQLEGEWSSVEGVQFNEVWEVTHDSLITGMGYSMNNEDTVFTERLKIYRTGNFVLYGAKVGDKPDYVFFRLQEAGKRKWTFVNPVHDYPNIIEYTIENDTLLRARTMNTNRNKVIEFEFKRVSQ